MRNDREDVVEASGCHVCGIENCLLHVGLVTFARGAFHHAAENDVAIAGVLHLRPGLKFQRIVSELSQRLVDARVVASVDGFCVVSIIANAALMREELPGGNRPRLLRKCGAVFLDRCVEIELAGFDQSHGADGSDGFGYRCNAEDRVSGGWNVVFDVGRAVAFGEDNAAIGHNRQRQAGDAEIADVRANQTVNRIDLRRRDLRDRYVRAWKDEQQADHKAEWPG